MSIFCSTIIPTVNRSTLTRAVFSALDQSLDEAEFEVIVVNDSGRKLPRMAWQKSKRVRVIDTQCRERSVARNTGAAIARGKYLHFLDDDDIFLPGALKAFWMLGLKDEAAWLLGAWQTMDNDGEQVDEFCPDLKGNIFALLVSGEGLPLQASLLQAKTFFAAGGFDPAIVGVEDRDLGRRIALLGDIAFTPAIVAKIRIGQVGSTTDWTRLAEDDRWGREKALSAQNALTRLRASVNSGYWGGRVSRAFFASMVWNLKCGSPLTATRRAVAGLMFTGRHLFTRGFWGGLRTKVR